jgi:hypothetical protein
MSYLGILGEMDEQDIAKPHCIWFVGYLERRSKKSEEDQTFPHVIRR